MKYAVNCEVIRNLVIFEEAETQTEAIAKVQNMWGDHYEINGARFKVLDVYEVKK